MNSTLTLVRYAKLENGWRRGKIAKTSNGKIKHPYMMVGGQETEAPQGRYQILRYEGKKPIYDDLGNDPSEALCRFKAAEKQAEKRTEAIRAAEAAGLSIEREQPAATDTRKTLTALAASFLEKHENLPHRSDDSLEKYTLITKTFCQTCKARYPEDVTVDDVIRWCGWLQKERGYSDRTRSNLYQSLRGWLKYSGLDPAKLIDQGTHKLLKAYTVKKPDMYTPEQVQALIDAALDEHEALLWQFAYATGLRDSELRMVTRFDLHGLDTEPLLHVKERDELGQIKDGEERTVELAAVLVPKLKKWLKDNPKKILLFGTGNDQPDGHMLRTLKRTARRAGLNCGHCSGCKRKSEDAGCRLYTLHKFRRTYTTRMLKATNGDLRSVMDRTGHSDLKSVMRYLAPNASVRLAVNQAF